MSHLPKARPLEWEASGEDWSDKHHGFYIEHLPSEEPEYRWRAACGEGDCEAFATPESAKAWCQAQLDGWVRQFVVASDLQCIKVWAWQDAPEALRGLSRHGGDEDWLER
jgi:hypothetical protein